MHKLYWVSFSITACILGALAPMSVNALVSHGVVISQVQVGNVSSSRFIEIYNNSDEPTDITNWCLYHSSASNKTIDKLICFSVPNSSTHLILGAKSYVLIGSLQFNEIADFMIDKGLGQISGGHIYIEDSLGNEIDRLGWGSAEVAEGLSPIVIDPSNSDNVLERKKDEAGQYIDTDVNSSDFFNSSLREEYVIGSIDEVFDVCDNLSEIQVIVPNGHYLHSLGECLSIPVDICDNIEGVQEVMLFGYEFDMYGDCQPDMCINIHGLQLILPAGMDQDGLGNCTAHDECLNLIGVQPVLPNGFKKIANGDCVLDLLPLIINELLPNAVGSDDGNEFIEIYNPNDTDVDLSNYILYVGQNYEHHYDFPIGAIAPSGQYVKFSNNDINFTLVNSSGRVQIRSIDNIVIDESLLYVDPDSGLSWALIDGVWQYTNRPTPGGSNLASLIENQAVESEKPEVKLVPCKDGQYRSEETNRCRNIVSDAVSLTPCAEGQERNPATNRCRSITSTSGGGDLKPCESNQERNPETNRCRNKVSNIPQVDYKPEQIIENSNNNVLYLSLAGVGTVAVGYGVWEWRTEIIRLTRKIFKRK